MRSMLSIVMMIPFLLAGINPSLRSQTPAESANTSDSSISAWNFSTSLYFYYLPDDDPFLLPIAYVDRDRLHLEARYNYEDFRTLSLFAGWSFGFGEVIQLEAIPMLGGVIGNTMGLAPALELNLTWRSLELYTEAEYVFDLEDSRANFFYNWAEVNYYPLDWLQLGITSQQTGEAGADWLVESGFLAGVGYRNYSGVFYLFNPGRDDLFYIFSLGVDF